MNKHIFFSVFFTLIFSLFPFAACDDGGENNNLTVDQNVKDWCGKWLWCSEEGRGYDNIPWETQEECEQIIQYIKNHENDNFYLDGCHHYLLVDTIQDCTDIDVPWQPSDYCSYTPFGVCVDGDPIHLTCPAVE